MDEIIQEKMKKNNEKYPVEKAKDTAKKYYEFQEINIDISLTIQ